MEERGLIMEWHTGFKPVIDDDSEILILGSFPSVKSRERGFYYGHPQNRFWKTLEAVFIEPVPNDILGKKGYLLKHKIALWDVIEKSAITGSSDADITPENSVPADFNSVIGRYPKIRLIICNGKKAYGVFTEFNPDCKVPTVCLPSTSPANGRFDMNKWIEIIREALKYDGG